MISTPQEMRGLTTELTHSVWTLGAIGALLESGLAAHLREPRSLDDLAARCPAFPRSRIERCLAVAAAVGVVVRNDQQYRLAEGAMPFAQPPMRAVLLGDVRAHLTQALAFLDSSSRSGGAQGWRHTDPAMLQAQGDASAGFAPMFKTNVVASLGDLAARLDRPDARFLDVGVGVGSLAIAMCRCWPGLHVVGLDVFDVPLALARQNVDRAAVADRIELRQLGVEDLREESSFDLAWLPSFFIAADVLPRAVARVHASLRPGGWMLLPIGGTTGEERARAVLALVNDIWGGPVLSPPDAESLLKAAGFSAVRVLPGPPSAPPVLAAQR